MSNFRILILAFLVVSTSLCVLRNAPKFLADIRSPFARAA